MTITDDMRARAMVRRAMEFSAESLDSGADRIENYDGVLVRCACEPGCRTRHDHAAVMRSAADMLREMMP